MRDWSVITFKIRLEHIQLIWAVPLAAAALMVAAKRAAAAA
jgi:hypothetical protein